MFLLLGCHSLAPRVPTPHTSYIKPFLAYVALVKCHFCRNMRKVVITDPSSEKKEPFCGAVSAMKYRRSYKAGVMISPILYVSTLRPF